MSDETAKQFGWREAMASVLHHSGGIRALERLSRFYERRPESNWNPFGWRRSASAKYVILCYHRVGTEGIPLYCKLGAREFEAQMRYIHERYRIVSLEDLCNEMEGAAPKGHGVAVTFDDGYRDLYTSALPVLQRYRIPATIFLTARAIETGEVSWYDRIFLAVREWPAKSIDVDFGRPLHFDLGSSAERLRAAQQILLALRKLPEEQRRSHCAALERGVTLPQDALSDRMLTWDQVREMQRGGICFGSHTMTHPVVSRLSPDLLETELQESKRVLEEKLGTPVLDFAYPFGQPADCGTTATPILIRCGYRSAATTSQGANLPSGNRFALRRAQIGEGSSLAMFAFRLNQFFLSGTDAAAGENATELSARQSALRKASRTVS
jgi:peptidoglycan/xylan/chitin deacetylase (PgdA/CDA1 family)